MAMLEYTRNGDRFPLVVRTLLGRSIPCQIRLPSPHVSAVHAEFSWDGTRWSVHDLGSRNGTRVDGRHLRTNQAAVLDLGSELMFGTEDDHCVLVDASAPGLVAIADDGTMLSAVDGRLCLSVAGVEKFRIVEQADGHWQLESDYEVRPVLHQERLLVGSQCWCIHLPGVSRSTEPYDGEMSIDVITLVFRVSRHDKYVEVRVEHGARSTRLKSRAHDPFLLALARARVADQARDGLEPAEQGWVARRDIIRQLDADRGLINVWTHRARRDFAKSGVADAKCLIERREGTEQIRLGVSKVRVERIASVVSSRAFALT